MSDGSGRTSVAAAHRWQRHIIGGHTQVAAAHQWRPHIGGIKSNGGMNAKHTYFKKTP